MPGGEDLFNEAVAAHKRDELGAAERLYHDHLRQKPDDARALGLLGILYFDQGRLDRAVEVLQASVAIDPQNAGTQANLGSALYELNRLEEAVSHFGKAIEIDGRTASSRYNMGLALGRLDRREEAAEALRGAAELAPDDAEVQRDFGHALSRLRRQEEAIEAYRKAVALVPDLDFARGALLHARMQLADWTDFEVERGAIEAGLAIGRPMIEPFPLLALTASRPLQLKLARRMAARWPAPRAALSPHPPPADGRIRLGYFSMDFGDHPVTHSLVELTELHDRSRFEVVGFALRRRPEDQFARRIIAAFDRVIDVSGMPDEAAARTAREAGIDVAIDLAGYTSGARTGIFAERAAPVQVAFLGYNATMGASFIDYLVTDAVAVPDPHRADYAERLIRLPSYHVSDRKREVASAPMSRSDHGLPQDGFVFCCFNQAYKIQPDTFASWMRILLAVSDSVLWLPASSAPVRRNLAAAAERAGVSPQRLIFGKGLPRPEYLARYALADLFLDTTPFNAVTTANDALWAGVPVLTLLGETFAGRMAASLLTALGVPELIATSPAAYEATAIELGRDRPKAAALKEKVRRQREASPLFDTDLFARRIEEAYATIVERWRAGKPSEDTRIAPRPVGWVSEA